VSAFDHLRAAREEGAILVLDGAMGTELESRGVPMDDDAWRGLANLTQPELVRAIHEDHIRAGADVITNTFMSGLGPMQRAGASESFTEGIDNAVRAARQAVQAVAERPVAIAGSIGTTPWGAPQAGSAAGLRDGYARQVALLTEGGVDVIALEMVTDVRLAVPALEAALASGLPVWLGMSMQVAGRERGESDSLPDFDGARAVAETCLTRAGRRHRDAHRHRGRRDRAGDAGAAVVRRRWGLSAPWPLAASSLGVRGRRPAGAARAGAGVGGPRGGDARRMLRAADPPRGGAARGGRFRRLRLTRRRGPGRPGSDALRIKV
jgi:hypothetical protein